MEKKKILKIILIIFLIAVIIVAINFIRNFIILSKISKNYKELNNFSLIIKITQDSTNGGQSWHNTKERYYRDGTEKLVLKDDDVGKEIILWHGKDEKELLIVRPYESTYSISDYDGDMHMIGIDPFVEFNLKEKLEYSLFSIITYDEINGEKCYVQKCYLVNNMRWFNTENGRIIKYQMGDFKMEYVEFNENKVTDNDIAKPDYTGYTKKF